MKLLEIFKPLKEAVAVAGENQVDRKYKYWRFRIFIGMYVGYAFYYFTRKSFTFAMPAMMQNMGFDKAQLGILASILSISYGLSKFLSGVVSDRSNPRYFMSIGLILTGVFNILFGMSSSLIFFALFWGLNGWFQGWGWPPCAKLLTHWYSQSERGRWWGVWNTSHNLGGAIIPLLAAVSIQFFGWRSALYVPGVLSILIGFFIMSRLRDTPQSMGLPEVETWRGEPAAEADVSQSNLSVKDILFTYVLKNKVIWVLSLAYFFVYILRMALNDWIYLYLSEMRGFTPLLAGSGVFWFEVGGFAGGLVAGWSSDKIFGGKRGPINVLFSAGVLLSVIGLWFLPTAHVPLMSLLMFLSGFFIFGPQMLIGMAAAELSHKKAAGTASGFTGWIGYLGAAIAGYPFGKLAQDFGWYGFFIGLAVCGAIALGLLIPLWGAKPKTEYAA